MAYVDSITNYSEIYNMIRNNLSLVREDISEICRACSRDASEVNLIGVCKVFPVEYAIAAYECGLLDLGENKVQEMIPKVELFEAEAKSANWHLIGTLQRNKVKYVVGKTNLIHSVDTLDLAKEIYRLSCKNNLKTRILLQANVSGEESKHGFSPDELKGAIDAINMWNADAEAGLGLEVAGLMTMAPIEQYEGQARFVFAKTKEIYDELSSYVEDKSRWNVLSMGMSQDYKAAIQEGSTHIRIGTAIFGNRAEYLAK